MASQRCILTWLGTVGGRRGHISTSILDGVASVGECLAFADGMGSKSNANVKLYHHSRRYVKTLSPPGGGANLDRICTVYLRNVSDGTVRELIFPDPIASLSVEKSQGERLTDAALADIVALVNASSSETFVGLYGVVTQKR